MFRISVGFACILLFVMCSALSLGLVPDQQGGRRCSAAGTSARRWPSTAPVALQQGDIAALEAGVKSICKRNPDIVSAGVRKTDGRLLVDVGDHAESWRASAADTNLLRRRCRSRSL